MDNQSTMEASTAAVSHGDVTFDTEETDNISEISNGPANKKHVVAPAKQQSTKNRTKLIKVRDTLQSSSKSKTMWAMVVVMALIVGILLGMYIIQDSNKEEQESTVEPIVAQSPTPSPSDVLQNKLESLLSDHTPLDERTMQWLVEESTWTPEDFESPDFVLTNTTMDYLWMERYAMAYLYFATQGQAWGRNDDWISPTKPVCEWYSMEYNKCPGPMKHLVLYMNDLHGTLPSVLFELTALEKIHLAHNDLTGSLPSSLSGMSNLKFVDLASNWLNGTLPAAIIEMTNLESLYLSDNAFSGSIPQDVGQMSNLQVLSWWGNYLAGNLPESVGNLTQLMDLSLSANYLSGSLPESIGQLTQLSRLSLHTNRLMGTIPESIKEMQNLQSLSLYENHFEGSFPELPITVRKCFLGSCFSDIDNAIASRCIFFDNCQGGW